MMSSLASRAVAGGSIAANWYAQLANTAWYPTSVGAPSSGLNPAGTGIGDPATRLGCSLLVFRYIPYMIRALPLPARRSPTCGYGAPCSSHWYSRPRACSAAARALCAAYSPVVIGPAATAAAAGLEGPSSTTAACVAPATSGRSSSVVSLVVTGTA